jgi:hypothetical protein
MGSERRRHGTILASFDVHEPTISNERSEEAKSQNLGSQDLSVSPLIVIVLTLPKNQSCR